MQAETVCVPLAVVLATMCVESVKVRIVVRGMSVLCAVVSVLQLLKP